MSNGIRQAKRSLTQQFLLDPLVGGVVFSFIGLLKILPIRCSSAFGGCLGKSFYYVMKKRNKIGRRNLEIAFPEKTADEREEILKRMWEHWGRVYGELPHAAKLYQQANITGLDYLKTQDRKKEGCFVCSAHFGNFEISASTNLFDDYCLNPVYRAANNPYIDKALFQKRKGVLIPKGTQGAKKMLDVLKSGKAIVILCDQKLREGISVPFFGKEAMTPSAIASVALKLNVPIMMAKCVRQTNGQFNIDVYPLEKSKNPNKQDAVYETMLSINAEMEKWIRQHPEQWLWIHRRFDKSEYK